MRVYPHLSAPLPLAISSRAHWDRREWTRYFNQRAYLHLSGERRLLTCRAQLYWRDYGY